ncbi:MAG: glycosyltransferase family 2 protein [Candidatus Omnitrophota bacterium]|nr:glycosyltransferase family 2 protein [Candidatus Omnitrophota bacterium]
MFTRDLTSPPIKLSIVLVHFKTVSLTLTCIESIYTHAPDCSFEIIVVDNGSNDDIEAVISDRYPEVRFIESGDNLGFTRGNNLGIHNSHGEYVVLLNTDTELIDRSFDAMITYMESHTEVGILGPRHVDGQGNFQLSFGHFPTFFSEIVRKLAHYRLQINDLRIRDYFEEKYSGSSVLDWVSGSCLMIRRDVLHDIGLLDERYFMYFEDIDLCTRARRRGWYVHYFPQTSIVHYGGQSVKRNLLAALIAYRLSQAYFARKYYGFFGLLAVRLLLLAKYGVNFAKWAVQWLFTRLMRKDTRRIYTMLLLGKKVITQVALGSISKPAPEPALHRPERLCEPAATRPVAVR